MAGNNRTPEKYRKLSIYLLPLNARAVLLDDETIGVVAKEDNLRSMISKVEHIRIIEDAAFQSHWSQDEDQVHQ